MNFLLDTNVAIAVIRNKPAAVRERLRAALDGGAEVAISTIATYELWYGVAKGPRKEEGATLVRAFLAGNFRILPFVDEDALVAGEIRAELGSRGTPIGPYDVLIAAQAVRGRYTLVTANVREFARVDGLIWEDWAK